MLLQGSRKEGSFLFLFSSYRKGSCFFYWQKPKTRSHIWPSQPVAAVLFPFIAANPKSREYEKYEYRLFVLRLLSLSNVSLHPLRTLEGKFCFWDGNPGGLLRQKRENFSPSAIVLWHIWMTNRLVSDVGREQSGVFILGKASMCYTSIRGWRHGAFLVRTVL